MERDQGRGEVLDRRVDRPPGQLLAHLRGQLVGEVGRERVGMLEDPVDERAERRSGGQVGHRGEDLGALRRRRLGQREVAGLVVERDHLGLAADAARLLGRPDQSRVGGASPRCVDRAVEGAHPEAAGRCPGWDWAGGRDARLLDDRPAWASQARNIPQYVGVGDLRLAAVGHRRLAGPASPQQPGQATVRLVPGRCPPRHHLGLGPSQRDVGEPDVVPGHLLAAPRLDGGEALLVLAADVEAAPVVLVVEHDLPRGHVAVEAEGQVDEGVLQPLADPDRHHLHRGRVAVEAPVALGRALPLAALGPQPVEQGRQPEALAVGQLVQDLRDVGQVGHVPLAPAVREHPGPSPDRTAASWTAAIPRSRAWSAHSRRVSATRSVS